MSESLQESTFFRIQGAEELVRRGVLPVEYLPQLKTALIKVDSNVFLPYPERSIFYSFVREILNIIFLDPTIKRLVQNRVAMQKHESTEYPLELTEDIDLRKAPDGMLRTFAQIVQRKRRAGGTPTESDRKIASRAKAEIRRRELRAMRNRMRESVDDTISDVLNEFGVESIHELSQEQIEVLTNKLNGDIA